MPRKIPHIASRAGNHTNDGGPSIDNRQMWRGDPEPITGFDLSDQRYSVADQARRNSPRSQSPFDAVNAYKPANVNSSVGPPGLLRSTLTRAPISSTRRHRRTSAPLKIAPQRVAMPMTVHSRSDYRSRNSVDNPNVRRLTFPAPLAPPLQIPEEKPIHDSPYPHYSTHHTSHFPRSHFRSDAYVDPILNYSEQYYNANAMHITNPLPSAGVRPHWARHRDSTGVNSRTIRPLWLRYRYFVRDGFYLVRCNYICQFHSWLLWTCWIAWWGSTRQYQKKKIPT